MQYQRHKNALQNIANEGTPHSVSLCLEPTLVGPEDLEVAEGGHHGRLQPEVDLDDVPEGQGEGEADARPADQLHYPVHARA